MKYYHMNRRILLAAIGFVVLGAALSSIGADNQMKSKQPNSLFIAVDDLRPQPGCYGHRETLSPNIDKLALKGTIFERAYCNVPVCGPSRVSVMTGIRANSGDWRNSNKVSHRMLFDHKIDPQENVNIAEMPDAQDTVDRLSKMFRCCSPSRSGLQPDNPDGIGTYRSIGISRILSTDLKCAHRY